MAEQKYRLGYPEPQNLESIERISPAELARLLRDQTQSASKSRPSVLPVDVRRADLTGGMITSSINLPAHTFYPSRHTIARTMDGVQVIVLFCGSSRGRGPRCAGWLRDALAEIGNTTTQVKILDGGIKGFLQEYSNDSDLVLHLPEEVKES